MIDAQETIKNARSFGLNTYEVKIWISLLSRGVATAGELSDIANVPRSRSYDVLESLEKKGFVTVKQGKPIKYTAVSPKDVLDKVKKKIELQKETHISQIQSQQFLNLINRLQDTHQNSSKKINNLSAVVRGARNIKDHVSYLCKNTKQNLILSIEDNTEDYLALLEESPHTNITLLSKNTETIPSTKHRIRKSEESLRMFLVDDEHAILFPLSERTVHPSYDFGIWIKHKETTQFLKQLLGVN